jgi:heme-degrading monooxygenase HmoA
VVWCGHAKTIRPASGEVDGTCTQLWPWALWVVPAVASVTGDPCSSRRAPAADVGRGHEIIGAAGGIGAGVTAVLVAEEAMLEEQFVWTTTRRISRGTLTDFEAAWRPDTHPDGMLRAYAYWSEDEQEIVGVSFWVSKESCDAWRASEAETRRREAMAPYVLEEREGFYRGRELVVPAH